MSKKTKSQSVTLQPITISVPVQLELPFHDAVNDFPPLTEVEYSALKEDIKSNGQRVPIVRCQGAILDGRARLRACQELGIEPVFEEVSLVGSETATDRIMSYNFHRRHLTDGQKGIIAARRATAVRGTNAAEAVTQGKAATELGISIDTVGRAKTVLAAGNKELIRAVETGKLDATTASRMAQLALPKQLDLLAGIEKESFTKKVTYAIKSHEILKRDADRLKRIEDLRKKCRPIEKQFDLSQYNVVYADPPWDHISEKEAGYVTMPLQQICAMPISKGPEACALFMWVPAGIIDWGLQVVKAWGFNYKTSAVWVKSTKGQGMGPYFRVDHEVLLFATRGELPSIPGDVNISSVLMAPATEHSVKPHEMYGIIESMYPTLPKIELFARAEPRVGWTQHGNEVVIAGADAKEAA